MNRVFQQVDLECGKAITLDKAASNHLLNVLRMRVGEQLIVFDGLGGEYLAELVAGKPAAVIELREFYDIKREPDVSIHLGQCLSRGERMDYALQKSVEVGVAEITPIFAERCNVKLNKERIKKRMQHWQGVIVSACEQSGRTILPILHEPCELTSWIEQCQGVSFICDFKQTTVGDTGFKEANLLIGPEGGLTAAEMALAYQHQFRSLFLGNLTLRTETAPVVAITLLTSVGIS